MYKRSGLGDGLKRLDLSGGTVGRTEYLFGGAMVLIIVAALILTIYSVWFSTPKATVVSQIPDSITFWCVNPNCGQETVLKGKDLDPNYLRMIRSTPPSAQEAYRLPVIEKPKCPKCGQNTLVPELVECPLCHKMHADNYAKDPQSFYRVPKPPEICDKCHGNITEYLEKQSSK